MQKIRKNNGITLISLVVIIVIMIILASISINFGSISLDSAKDESQFINLNILQKAVIEQYSKAKLLKLTEKKVNDDSNFTNKPEMFYGEPIVSNKINTVTEIEWKNDNYTYYEDYYYRLGIEDLEKLGVSNTEDIYVVNYKTGEVYNETKKTSFKDVNLYVYLPENNNNIEDEIDKTFSDDE